jgi:hypothetical protein
MAIAVACPSCTAQASLDGVQPVDVPVVELEAGQRVDCDFCATSVPDFHRRAQAQQLPRQLYSYAVAV